MGEGDFRPSTARRPLHRFSWNLKYITTSRTRPRTQNFRGLRRRGWSGQIASLTHESFCPFFVPSPGPHVASLDTPPRAIRHYTSFWQGSAFWGWERCNLKFDPLFPKKRKNWDFKLKIVCRKFTTKFRTFVCATCFVNSFHGGTVQHAKFKGPMSTWVVWANSQFDAWKFLSFFPFLVTPTGRIFGHIPTLNTSLCVVPAKEVPFGG